MSFNGRLRNQWDNASWLSVSPIHHLCNLGLCTRTSHRSPPNARTLFRSSKKTFKRRNVWLTLLSTANPRPLLRFIFRLFDLERQRFSAEMFV